MPHLPLILWDVLESLAFLSLDCSGLSWDRWLTGWISLAGTMPQASVGNRAANKRQSPLGLAGSASPRHPAT